MGNKIGAKKEWKLDICWNTNPTSWICIRGYEANFLHCINMSNTLSCCKVRHRNVSPLLSYLMILGEELGEFFMPPLRCFFLGDNADCWSSSTATQRQWSEGGNLRRTHKKIQKCVTAKRTTHSTIWGQWTEKIIQRSGRAGEQDRMDGTLKNLRAPLNSRQHTLAHHWRDCVWKCKRAIAPSSTIMPICELVVTAH